MSVVVTKEEEMDVSKPARIVGAGELERALESTKDPAAVEEVGTSGRDVDISAAMMLQKSGQTEIVLQPELSIVPPPLAVPDSASPMEEVVRLPDPPGMEEATGRSEPPSVPTFGVASRSAITSFAQGGALPPDELLRRVLEKTEREVAQCTEAEVTMLRREVE
ncbi:hypothetical protein Nepgr_028382 [Nepenthes gracilis]|uniref:Uncharacterized protein n=1 Tax=Nepenthes gracilis TaxID=150966 RepID=A0AAD3TCR6_NEPGR|nr:hypothetical protein Nepgr_028382 [Nepenthes gracilis]